ncbi:hypothetical protein KIM372_14360 [Bombiscardovia nodaiensis]|uniref:ABC transporter substrate-binding protein n=1 Tax=Bombiscardovia nodaiensis TaxID=2932181 RepID=A0ABM8B9F6_9BIFI|nr:hypothetical protein KIM372_14360 [Bombiscardovia nodaiensis]
MAVYNVEMNKERGSALSSRWARLGKLLLALLAVAGMVLATSGCGGAKEQKVLYFWNGLVGDDGPAMQRIIKAYNAQNPEYKVVFQPMNGGDLTTKIYSVMQTGRNIPDLVIQDQFTNSVLQSQGLLNPSSVWTKYQPELKKSAYLPQAWDNTVVSGTSYGIPLYLFQMAIYYNKGLVHKYGLDYILKDGLVTTDEIASMKGKLPKDVYGLCLGNLPWSIMSMLYSAGGNVEDGVKDMTAPVWRKPLKALRDLNDQGMLSPIDSDGEQVFASGHSVFGMLGTWAQGNMSKTLGKDKVAEANTLQYGTENPSNFLWQQNWVQLKDKNRPAERTKAAADFIDFVYKHWMMWSDVGSISPAYRDLNNPDYQKLIQASFTNGKNERKWIKTSNYLYGGYATAAWGSYMDIVYGNVSLDEGLKTLDLMTQGQIQIQEQS